MPRFFRLLLTSLLLASSVQAGVVINEILYRPGAAYPENPLLEFVELHNTDAAPVDISGWAFTSGIAYTFPAATTIAAGGFVVVAGSPSLANSTYGRSDFFGPWTGGLSNNTERVRISKPGVTPGTFDKVDEVTYANEGDWATRVRVASGTGAGGWDWSTGATLGRSMELRNPNVSNDNGQNWAASAALNGTPGAVNSARVADIAPIIKAVKHSPAVPKSTEPVKISCELNDETAAVGLTATVFWRTGAGAFQQAAMAGDGAGNFSATLPAMADLSIVEFYIAASDGAQTRTWPATTAEGQTANCQYQVTNEVLNAKDTYYFIVMTAAENAIFDGLATSSDRQMNQTFITYRAGETSIRYRSAMRIRGKSSRTYVNKPMRVSIPGDDLLDGESTMNLNPKYPWLQFAGMRLMQASGLRAGNALPIELRRNGVEYTTGSGSAQDYGKWVRVEDEGRGLVSNHWPNASSGSFYKNAASSTTLGWRSGNTAPSTPDGTIDGWSKQNNGDANDWSDYLNFATVWQTQAANHFTGGTAGHVQSGTWLGTAFSNAQVTQLETVADLDQFARWFAVMTIFADNETNISNGREDDYGAYFYPETDGRRRMQLVPHDFDTIFGQGDTPLTFNGRGLYDMTEQGDSFHPLQPLFGDSTNLGNAAFRAKYHTAIRELFATVLNADTTGNSNPAFYQFLDANLGGWVPAGTITAMKTWMTNRQAYLLGQIGAAIPPPTATSTPTLAASGAGVVIHEVLAKNSTAYTNGATHPDVIELRNLGATTVDISGMTLSDDPAVPTKFAIPAGTTLAAGQILVVHADTAIAEAGLHAGFQLDQDGDDVFLYASVANGGALVDSVAFGVQASDFSIGRTGGALDTWALCTPTIGAANTAVATLASPALLKINEWGPNPDYLLSGDFVEIYNPSAQPAPIGGMRVTDDAVNYPSRHVFPALSFMPASGFLRLNARGNSASASNSTELAFGFSSTFGSIALLGANGTTVDQVAVVGQPRDTSTGRSPDGAVTLVQFALPTTPPSPGASNVAPPANVLNLINFLRITEILFRPNTLEFIELTNIGNVSLDLSGVQFTAGVGYTFEQGTTLAPGAFIVICKDRAAFLAQYGGAVPLAAGVFTGTLDNAGETIALQPPPPWNINILNFSYQLDWFIDATANHSYTTANPAGTAARDWNEKETWLLSAQPLGTPGNDGPPILTSALTANATAGASFTYQIAAAKNPASFGASGLPAGLSVSNFTGLISGTPTVVGVFNVIISASNSAGADSDTLVLTVETPPVPAINSSLAVNGSKDVPFTYQITATNGPTSYDATGLPAWLTVNVNTGLLSGTPPTVGVFPVTIVATNFNGSDSETLTISVAAVGPFSHFAWDVVPTQIANTPFSVTLRALDANDRAVDYDGPVSVGASSTSSLGVVLTEFGCSSPTPDYFEIQNLGAASVDTTGWFVITSRASQGVNSPLATSWALPASLASGQIVGSTDGTPSTNETYYGVDIDWAGNGPSGWVMLSDASGVIRDFCAWGYTAAELATINFTFKGFNYTLGSQWTGDGAPRHLSGTSLFRSGTSDNNDASDWSVAATPSPRGAQNSGLVVSGPLTILPVNAALVDGVWTGSVSVLDVGSARLTASAAGAPVAESNAFQLSAPTLNTPPTFTKGSNVSVPMDSGVQTVGAWATGIRAGASSETAQTVSFNVVAGNTALFSTQPAVSSSGTLTFTAAAHATGSTTVSVTPQDDGGTAGGGINTGAAQTFTITIQPNMAPSFVKGAGISIGENAGGVTRANWATAISTGSGETGQTFSFTVTNSNNALFSTQPAVAPNGTLTFILAGEMPGVATVSVNAVDNGGTANGGVDSSAVQTFTITVVEVNTAPSFTVGADVSVRHNAGLQSIVGFATNISAGPAAEASQTLAFEVSNSATNLFVSQPAISPSGTLSFSPHPTRSGTATITATLRDSGGTLDGGVNFVTHTFTITTRAVNDPPTFTAPTKLVVGVRQSYAQQFATSVLAGPSDEAGQTVAWQISNDHPELFTLAPSILSDGKLVFTAGSVSGTATLTIKAKDNGGVLDGGVDESAPTTLTLRISSALEAIGDYYALVEPNTGITRTNENIGSVKLTLAKGGSFSGGVVFGGQKFALKGRVSDTGIVTFSSSANDSTVLVRKVGSNVILKMQIQIGEAPSFTATIQPAGNVLLSRFTATRPLYGKTVPVPSNLLDPLTDKGKYTAALLALMAPNNGRTAAEYPQGDGIGDLAISKTGSVTLKGKLADGTAFTVSSALLAGDTIPLYVPLYSAKGSLSGVATARSQTDSDVDGAGFHWFRPLIVKPAHPGWPLGISVDLIAAKLLPKATPLFPSLPATDTDGNAAVDLTDATLGVKAVNVDTKNKVAVITVAADKLTATASAATGKFGGSFISPNTGKAVKFAGTLLRKAGYGTGYYLDGIPGGRVRLTPTP